MRAVPLGGRPPYRLAADHAAGVLVLTALDPATGAAAGSLALWPAAADALGRRLVREAAAVGGWLLTGAG